MASQSFTPAQRKAAFQAAYTLKEITAAEAARRLGVSYNHLVLVLAGERAGSTALQQRIANFLQRPVTEVFPASGSRSTR
jgi:transcriptional regulator with XRE-family HTH domain